MIKVNKLEKILVQIRNKGLPSTIVVDNDMQQVYVRVLIPCGLKHVSVLISDRDVDDKVDYTIEDLYALDVDCDVDKLLQHIINMINNNMDKLNGATIS